MDRREINREVLAEPPLPIEEVSAPGPAQPPRAGRLVSDLTVEELRQIHADYSSQLPAGLYSSLFKFFGLLAGGLLSIAVLTGILWFVYFLIAHNF